MSVILNCKIPVLQKGQHIITNDYSNHTYTLKGKTVKDFHKGVDLVGGGHTTDFILAFADGKVTVCQYGASAGNYVQLDHGNGVYTRYMHMKDAPVVKVGQAVKKGQVLGYMGSTGNSTGAHLHFDICMQGTYVDPKPYLKGEKAFAVQADTKKEKIAAFQRAAMADGIRLPKYGANGYWGAESEKAAKTGVVKKRIIYRYKHLTKIVQTAVGVRVDGYCGKDTDAAIRAWQRKQGLTPDGAFGPACWRKYLGM